MRDNSREKQIGSAGHGGPRHAKATRVEQVITALALGKPIKQIALDWGRTRYAVEFAWSCAKQKYGFQCYQDATRYAIKQGWVGLDGAPAGK